MENILSKLLGKKGIKKDKEISTYKEEGYTLLMDIIDRKVFEVEDRGISKGEFESLNNWVVFKFNHTKERVLAGKIILEDPLILAEVIEGEPVFLEVHDYGVRYRVNIYQDREDIDIKVLEEVKEKELQLSYRRGVSYQL